jgi:hypothetical protein
MSNEITESLVSVDELLQTLGAACIATASRIETVSNSTALGGRMRYVVPAFKVSVRLSFTKTGDSVKGILFWKKTEGVSAEALSQIDMEIVAVPRDAGP